MDYTVYILRCSDGSYYTGVTNDLARRLFEHEQCLDPKSYVFKRRPLRCVYAANFEDINEAISWEKTIKRWSRKKKEALIRDDDKALKQLSQRHTHYVSKQHPPVSP
jgi:putative endonuclease